MTKVSLREVVSVSGGGTPRKSFPDYFGGGIPWVTPKDMKRSVIGESEITLTASGVQNSPAKLVPEGSILVVVRSGVLKHTLPVARTVRPVTVNQDMKALVPSARLDASYLARLLKAVERRILSWVRATTADNFPIDKLLDLEFDLPPPDEQRRIAAILDHVDALRAKRRQVLVHLDALTQSIFHDMFGTETYPRVAAGTFMPQMRNGLSPATAGRYPAQVLTLSAVTGASFDATAVKSGLFAIDPPSDKRVNCKDFLMCRGNGNKTLVGVGTFSRSDRQELVFPDTVIAGRVDPERVVIEFLDAAWKQQSVRQQIQAGARTTNGTYKVNQQTLSRITVPLPPLSHQEEFAARIGRIGVRRPVFQRAQAANDELFAALQFRAFRMAL